MCLLSVYSVFLPDRVGAPRGQETLFTALSFVPRTVTCVRIFLTQVLNPGLLHCRQILYHLSYREVPAQISKGEKFSFIAFIPLTIITLYYQWRYLVTKNCSAKHDTQL